MGAGNLTDEQLLKRAGNAGRKLGLLGILATLGAFMIWAVLLLGKGATAFMLPVALAVSSLAAGYWVLAVAARRGNPNSVGVVLVIMVLQLLIVFVTAGIAAARTNTPLASNLPGLIIPTLVLIALVNSRGVLLELQDRGLWEKAFVSVKASGTLCVIGGILVAAGLVLFDGGTAYVSWKVGQARAEEIRGATEFVHMIKSEEQAFMAVVGDAVTSAKKPNLDLALAKLELLESRVKSLQETAGPDSSLPAILQSYRNAIREWKNALLALDQSNPDRRRAQQMLALGDKLRAQAVGDFQTRFAPKPLRPAH
jgi:hypothetical protein